MLSGENLLRNLNGNFSDDKVAELHKTTKLIYFTTVEFSLKKNKSFLSEGKYVFENTLNLYVFSLEVQ